MKYWEIVGNKLTAAGRQAYLATRRAAHGAGANLIEVDLVLQGQPTLKYSRDSQSPWDYAVAVTRSAHHVFGLLEPTLADYAVRE